MTDTIVGLATAPGEGGIAIVRVSGDEAVHILEQAFQPAGAQPPFENRRMMYGHITDGEKIIDEVMAVVMYAPGSYTRENVCEIHTHGGSTAAALVIKRLISLGARPAEPGEFTRRAFMNGRIDLAQAEAVMGVISARSEAALRAQERQLAGGQSRFVRELQQELLRLLAGLEAHIDYPDEIDEEEAISGLLSGLESLCGKLRGAIDVRGARIIREGLHVALCGLPNAGKSTLFNALLGEDRAIVTDIPGTTRDVLEGSFPLNGINVYLKDTAGLRNSTDTVEQLGVERARAELRRSDVALELVDASLPMSDEVRAFLSEPIPCERVLLLTKADCPMKITPEEARVLAPDAAILPISAKTEAGLPSLRDKLKEYLNLRGDCLLLHERHMQLASEALRNLENVRSSLQRGELLDLAAVEMHEALYLLGRITGENVDEQLLDDIFSRFCVGK